MSVDAQGFIWLSDPVAAAAAVAAVTGLLLWCHRVLSADVTREPAAVPVRADDARPAPTSRTDAYRRPAA